MSRGREHLPLVLLKLRQRRQNDMRQAVAAARAAQSAVEADMRWLSEALAGSTAAVRAAMAAGRPADAATYGRICRDMTAAMDEGRRRLAACDDELGRRRRELLLAMRQRKAMERAVQRARRAHALAQQRQTARQWEDVLAATRTGVQAT
jgi:hypothetical protein